MRITADTNLLVRLAVQDDEEQTRAAGDLLARAELIAVPVPVFCEFVWVLSRSYRRSAPDIARAIRLLLDSATVRTDVGAVEAGLAMLELGGGFADGVIAYQGRELGGDLFASFDAPARRLLAQSGTSVIDPLHPDAQP